MTTSNLGRLLGVVSAAAIVAASTQAQNNTRLAQRLESFLHRKPYFPEGFTGSVLVARDGQIVLHRSYGLASADPHRVMPLDAIWDWCSVSKQFTAAAILKLQEKGKLELSDPLTKHFRGAPKDKRKVTVRHLLTHTSGIENDRGYGAVGLFDRKASVRYLLTRPLTTEPGEVWKYNNSGYFLLAGLIEQVSGKRYEDFLRREVLSPAGMESAGCVGDAHIDYERVPFQDRGRGEAQFAYGRRLSWGYRGAGGVLASTADMHAWDRALRGDRVLGRKARQELFRPNRHGYALGWRIAKTPSGEPIAYHSGNTGSTVTFFLRYLEKDISVALAFSHKPGKRAQMAAMSLGGVTEAAPKSDLVEGDPIALPEVVQRAMDAGPAPPARTVDVEEWIGRLEDAAQFARVCDQLAEHCGHSKVHHRKVMRALSAAQHRRGVTQEMVLRYTMVGRMLNERVLHDQKRREIRDCLAAVIDCYGAVGKALPRRPSAQMRKANEALSAALDSLSAVVRADLPLGTRPEYAPGR